jgi:hypothetical protein
MFNLFGSQSNYPQFPLSSLGIYQSTYQGMGQYHKKAVMRHQLDPWVSSKVAEGLVSFDESSPIGSASPVSQQQQWIGVDPVNTPVWSDNESNLEESKKKERKK